jgi:hypothetical protein
MKASRSKQRSEKPMNELEQYVKLENRLVLLAWLNSLLGYGSNRELLEDTKTVAEGFAADGPQLHVPSPHCPRRSGPDSRRRPGAL